MREVPLFFEHADERLCGVVALPDEPTPGRPGVVLLHGWTAYRIGPHRIFVKMAEHLAEAGYPSIRFDFRGRGDSTGDSDAATLDTMIDDALRAAELLQQQSDCTGVVYAGLCSGGNVALGAATLDGVTRGVVPMSTLMFMEHKKLGEAVHRTAGHGKTYLKKLFRLQTWKKLFGGAINWRMVRKVLFGHYGQSKDESDPKRSDRDILAGMAELEAPMLFVYGTADPEGMAARPQFEQVCTQAGLPVRFDEIDGANHDYYSLAWEQELFGKVTTWLDEVTGR